MRGSSSFPLSFLIQNKIEGRWTNRLVNEPPLNHILFLSLTLGLPNCPPLRRDLSPMSARHHDVSTWSCWIIQTDCCSCRTQRQVLFLNCILPIQDHVRRFNSSGKWRSYISKFFDMSGNFDNEEKFCVWRDVEILNITLFNQTVRDCWYDEGYRLFHWYWHSKRSYCAICLFVKNGLSCVFCSSTKICFIYKLKIGYRQFRNHQYIPLAKSISLSYHRFIHKIDAGLRNHEINSDLFLFCGASFSCSW